MKLFSTDDHIIEPRDTWSSRVPRKYLDAAPHVVEEDGQEYWEYEDVRGTTMGLNAVVGKPHNLWSADPVRFDEMRKGCWDPLERARDLIAEGVTASAAFPTLPRFSGALFASFNDKELADVCVRAWNDFLFDEWCAAAPEMFVPMIIVQLWDPKAAALEIERNLARGARAVILPEEPSPLGMPSWYDTDHWDPVWSTIQAAGVPACMHIGSSGMKPFLPPGGTETLRLALGFVPTVTHAMGMAFGPVPKRYPDIKIVYSEGGIGWVPSAVERAESRITLHGARVGDADVSPREIFSKNFWFCAMPDDDFGIAQRELIGVDRIMWELDYPHSNSPWPESSRHAQELLADVSEEDFRLIAHENAEKLFNWRCPDTSELAHYGDRLPL
jgi:predicted TIM-barrel fold metal-dependent hydrolase